MANGTQTSAFGTSARINHDSSKFYNSRMYKELDAVKSQAVQKALKEIDNLILENHLKMCTADAIKDGRSEEAVEELMTIFKKNS